MRKIFMCAFCLLLALGSMGIAQEDSKAVYKDSHAAIADRVHDLMSRMTVEEKVAQLESGWTLPSFGGFYAIGI